MEADEVVVLGTGSTIAPSLKRILEEGVTQMASTLSIWHL